MRLTSSVAVRHTTVMLEYFHPWTNSAGLYFARAEGWFREIGLDVDFQLFDPGRGDTLAYLAAGEVDFGVFPSNRLFVRREKGDAVLSIAAINHRALETIQTVRSTGIQRSRDLAGRRVALNPTPRGMAMVRHLVEADGGDASRLSFVDTGARELCPEEIEAGVADASFGSYWAWDTLLPSTVAAADRLIWPVDTIGAPRFHGYLLGCHERTALDEPSLVRDFLAVAERGYLAVAREPQSALPIYQRVAPYVHPEIWHRSLPLIASTWLHEGQWGEQREALLRPYAEWLASHGILQSAEIWRAATDNSFLRVGQAV